MTRTLTTSGTGGVGVPADGLRIDLAATATAPTVPEALERTALAVAAAGEVVRRYVDGEALRSTGLSVWTRTSDDGRVRGYDARHGLTVVCPGLDRGGDLVTELASALGEALRLDGVQPVVTDPAPLLAEARSRAFADARATAEHLAGLAGAALGEVVAVVDGAAGAVGDPRPVAVAAKLAATRFEPGGHEVAASVTVTWELVAGS